MLDKGGLDKITTFGSLIEYLRDQLDWPIEELSFDDLTYEWDPKEFGLKSDDVASQIEIKQLRPIAREPWGIFFLSLPHRKIPVTVLRRILGSLAPKKRASANPGDRAVWSKSDLLFIAAHGEGAERGLAFAHFHEVKSHGDLPTLKLLGWDGADTVRRLSATHDTLKKQLHWRIDGETDDVWRSRWTGAFSEKPGEVVATSKAMAKELARLAREIRRRANELLAEESDRGPLRKLHAAFKEALIHDLKFDDFADMYAQTIAYGLLSARISRESGSLTADDTAALAPPTNPFLKKLLETFLRAGGRSGGMDFDELGVNDVVEMLRRANMEAVLADFDDRNPNEDPVIHFYELFLKEYDAQKRMQRGVFYTPRPVVSFIIRSVDEVLRTEFGLEDGLASTATWGEVIAAKPEITLPEGAEASDPFVRILDPATGTGTFLVETIDLIWNRMRDKWRKAGKSSAEIAMLWNDYVPGHLLPRLYGFELMMAPYAIAHMKLGLKLHETGYRFGSDERARIYLTNALEPAQDFDMQLAFMSEALAHEAQAANAAKEVRFTVVVGNPPYSGKSKNRGSWIEGLMLSYKESVRENEVQVQAISNDYIKFVRLAEYCSVSSSAAVLGFITSGGYLSGPLFKDVRRHIAGTFDDLWLLDLHGSGRRGPASGDDENVFDIIQGVAVLIGSRLAGNGTSVLGSGDLIGPQSSKFASIATSTIRSLASERLKATPPDYLFKPREGGWDDLLSWPVPTIFGTGSPKKDRNKLYSAGFETRQDSFVMAIAESDLSARIADLADSTQSQEELKKKYRMCSTAHFKFDRGRSAAKSGELNRSIRFLNYRPFDRRYFIWSRSVLCEPQQEVTQHISAGDICLVVSRVVTDERFAHAFVSEGPYEKIGLSNKTSTNAYMFPLVRRHEGTAATAEPNLSPDFLRKLEAASTLTWDDCIDAVRLAELADVLSTSPEQTGMFAAHRERGDLVSSFGPRDVFDWIYAVLHSPAYRARYADYLKSDFARIPLPGSHELFQALVPLGTELVALHLLDAAGAPGLKDPQAVRFAGHGEARVEQAGVWSPPSDGRVTISDHRWFEGVPERVWNFHIGGYQPAQKWLKDRARKGGKKAHPGRILTAEDQLHYRRMIAAMDRTIDLMAEIDRVIDQHGGWPGAFKRMNDEGDVG